MNTLPNQKRVETQAENEMSLRMADYFASDMSVFSPIFYVQDAQEGFQGATNYVMTSLIKAYKEQSDSEPTSITKAVVSTMKAFQGSTKKNADIMLGINECERLALIKCDRTNGEITLLDKCFNAAHVI